MRRRGTALAVIVAALCMGGASAEPSGASFDPAFDANSISSVADASTQLVLRVTQHDQAAPIRSYDMSIPNWRIALGSIDQASVTSCRDITGITSGTEKSQAEKVGEFQMRVATDATRDPNPRNEDVNAGRQTDVATSIAKTTNGSSPDPDTQRATPAFFSGELLFLRWDTATTTATVCGYAWTNNSRIPGTNREIMIQMTAVWDSATKVWHLRWNNTAVPGAPPGERSILDNNDFRAAHASIVETRLTLDALSKGNYNRNPAGSLASVALTRNPALAGDYVLHGVLTPCPNGDPLGCGSSAVQTDIARTIRLTTAPVGYHPAPTLAKPARFAVMTGTSAVPVEWTVPPTTAGDPIKGYLLILAHPSNALDTDGYHVERFIVDKNDAAYDANLDPCPTAETDATCRTTLAFPLSSVGGRILDQEGLYSLLIVTLFEDGHRSDGRCDDGSALGKAAPCADGSSPAFIAPGMAKTEFLLTKEAWPLIYQRKVVRNSRAFGVVSATGEIDHAEVLFANLASHRFRFVYWFPGAAITNYQGSDAWTIAGDNTGAGSVTFASPGFVLDAGLTPQNAAGTYQILSAEHGTVSLIPFLMTRI